MDETGYNQRRRVLVKKIRNATTAIDGYSEADVAQFDVSTGGVTERLKEIRAKVDDLVEFADDLLDDIEESEAEQIEKGFRKTDIEKLKTEIVTKAKENDKKVKTKASEFLEPVPVGDTAAEAIPRPTLRTSDSTFEKDGRIAKVKVVMGQVTTKSQELKNIIKKLPEAKTMKELEVKETLIESKEWIKQRNDISKMVDTMEQEGAMMKVNVEEATSCFETMKHVLAQKIDQLKLEDKEKGYHSLTTTKAKETIVYPKPFSGEFGANIYKWTKEMKEAIDSAQLKEDDKVKKLKQYLAGDAKVKVGDYHKTLESAVESLIGYYGNPRAIWGKCRRELKEAVGNFRENWGEYGSQKRVLAIARTQDFIREAEALVADFPDTLENEIYSGATTGLLREILPREYLEKVNDTVSNVNISDKEKIEAIKVFLEARKRSAILGLDVEGENSNRDKKSKGTAEVNTSVTEGHDCSKEKSCKKQWGLIGCIEIYKINSARSRRSKILQLRGCVKCGSPFRKEKDGAPHKCKWYDDKLHARCTSPSCEYAACLCGDHEENSNCSADLLKWVRDESVTTNIFTLSTSSSSSEYESAVEEHSAIPVQEKFINNVGTSDEQVVKELAKKGRKFGIKERNIRAIPEGMGTFELCVVKGKSRPLLAFIDSGADSWITSDEAVNELVSVKLRKGPIPLRVASGKTIHATGEWGALLPLSDGTHQTVRGLSLPEVAAKTPTFKLRTLLEKIKRGNPDNAELQMLEIPEEIGEKVDMIIGQRYKRIHPRTIIKLESGLEVRMSRLAPWIEGEIATIAGPMAAFNDVTPETEIYTMFTQVADIMTSMRENQMELDFDMCNEGLPVDMDIPGSHEFLLDQDDGGEESDRITDLGESETNQVHTVQGDLDKLLSLQSAGLDMGFRCSGCRLKGCLECKKGAGNERISLVQEKEQCLIQRSVKLDLEKGTVSASLPFKINPEENLTVNKMSAQRRLDKVLEKYADEPETLKMIKEALLKLYNRKTLRLLQDMSEDERKLVEESGVSYYMPWDISFKGSSLTTPARPCFDASAVTSTGNSLNSILAVGCPDFVKLVKMLLEWSIGPVALVGDISQYYPSVQLVKEHWRFQRVLLREDLKVDGKLIEAVIAKLIFGVASSGGQCEEAMRKLCDAVPDIEEEVEELILRHRYVDDFLKSVIDLIQAKDIAAKTETILALIDMKVKGWAFSSEDPPESMSEDGETVMVAGLKWTPKLDNYKLSISPLFFGSKRRGRIPKGVDVFKGKFGINIKETLRDFAPEEMNRKHATTITCRVWDPLGKVAPLTNRLKNDLRRLNAITPDWGKTIPRDERERWIGNISLLEELRDIIFMRCCIPMDAIDVKAARIFVMNDAATTAIITGVYACYERRQGGWSCQLIYGKGLLAPQDKTLPQVELQVLSNGADITEFVESALDGWISNSYIMSDNEICLAWCSYESIKLNVFERNRVVNVLAKVKMDQLMHVQGKANCADIGTRPDSITVQDVAPGSEWASGQEWMRDSIESAMEKGIVKTIEKIHLGHEEKKIVKEAVTFEEFDEEDTYFGVMMVSQEVVEEVTKRALVANYLYFPIKRSFESVVRITAMALRFVRKIQEKIKKRKNIVVEFRSIQFRLYNQNKVLIKNLHIESVNVIPEAQLSEFDYSEALRDIYKRCSKEVKAFNTPKALEKIAIEEDGILYSRNRIMDGQELQIVGELKDMVQIGNLTRVNFKVPLIDYHSPAAVSIAYHMHKLFIHRGTESTYRLSLEHVNIVRGKHIFRRISEECTICLKKRSNYVKQLMGSLHESQLSITPIFYATLMDAWGPLTVYAPGYERATRRNKPYSAYMLVMVCCATGSTNCQIVEGIDAGSVLEGLNRFFAETCVPTIMYPDEAGGMVKALTRGELDIGDLSGNLRRQKGIIFQTCAPQGHFTHGRVERKIGLIQESLKSSGLLGSRTTYSGWSTLAKLVEREINEIPLGYLNHKISENSSPLLRLLTPASLKLQTRTDRAPRSPFAIPNHPKDVMSKIDEVYRLWYAIWAAEYIPLVMGREKWLKEEKNLQENDVIWFKLKESPMSAEWRLGKVEKANIGRDGLVREVLVAYRNMEDVEKGKDGWKHMVVLRPVRNVVKLFSVEDTTLMDDMQEVQKLCEKVIHEELYGKDDLEKEAVAKVNMVLSEFGGGEACGEECEEECVMYMKNDKFRSTCLTISKEIDRNGDETLFLL